MQKLSKHQSNHGARAFKLAPHRWSLKLIKSKSDGSACSPAECVCSTDKCLLLSHISRSRSKIDYCCKGLKYTHVCWPKRTSEWEALRQLG